MSYSYYSKLYNRLKADLNRIHDYKAFLLENEEQIINMQGLEINDQVDLIELFSDLKISDRSYMTPFSRFESALFTIDEYKKRYQYTGNNPI